MLASFESDIGILYRISDYYILFETFIWRRRQFILTTDVYFVLAAINYIVLETLTMSVTFTVATRLYYCLCVCVCV